MNTTVRKVAEIQQNVAESTCLNPRMRILKYDAKDDDRFDAHFDATTEIDVEYGDNQKDISKKMKSLITVLVYLNNGDGVDFVVGET